MRPRYDVFLSHSSADKTAVEGIAHKLREKGIEPFLDKWHLVPGEAWQEALEEALDESATCAVFLGPGELGPWQNEEMRSALDERVRNGAFRVIPVLLPGARQPGKKDLPRFLRRLTWVDFQKGVNDGEALRLLICGIRGEAPGPGEEAKPPISNYRSMAIPPEGFVHRREYDRVVEALCADNPHGSTVGITTALRGAGGFGKTALAQAVCQDERVREKYPNGILLTTMGEDIDANGRLSRVLDLIREWTEKEPPGFENIIAASSHLRKLLSDRKILLVIDDVWSPVDLIPFQGLGPEAALLVTTRNSQTLPPDAQRIEVDAMTSVEAVSLLQAGLSDGERKSFEDLACRLGEWPLLLKIVNRQLRELTKAGGLTTEEALREVEEALEAEGLTAFDVEDPEDRQRAVSQTINVSLKKLTEEERERYKQLAVFPEDALVPLYVLERLWGLNRFETKKFCGRLHDLSLLLDFDRRAGTIRLHDVIRQFLIRQWGSDIAGLHGYLLDACPCWSQLPREEEYLWRHLSYHLLAAGRNGELRDLLLDLDYLLAKLKATDVNSLLGDYEELSNSDDEFRLIQGAIRMSAHIITKYSEQLAPHLLGRLLGGETANLKHLLDQCRKESRFRPQFPCLQPPGSLLRTIEVGSPVNALAVVEGRCVVSGSDDRTLRVWDLDTGTTLRSLEGHNASVSAVVTLDGRRAVSGSEDGTLRVWDLEAGKTLRTLEGHNGAVLAVAVLDDYRAVSGSIDGTLRVWDLETGQTLRTLKGHNDWVTAVAVVDGRRAVSGSDDGVLRVWDLETGQSLQTLKQRKDAVLALAVLDGRRAISGTFGKRLRVWDLESGKVLQTLRGHNHSFLALAVLDGRLVISGSDDGTLRIWDLEAGQSLQALQGHNDSVRSLVVLDGWRAVSGSDDGTLRVWDLKTGPALRIPQGHSAWVRTLAAVNRWRAVSGSDDGTLQVWDLKTGQSLRTIRGHKASVKAVTVLDDRHVVSSSDDGTLRIWDLETGQTLRILRGHEDSVLTVAVLDSGHVVSGSDDRTIRVWNLETGEVLKTISHDVSINDLVALNGHRAVSSSFVGTPRVWDLETGQTLHTLQGLNDNNLVTGVAILDDRRAVSVSDDDGTLWIWDLGTGQILQTLKGPNAWVRAVAVIDSRRSVLGLDDGTLRVWDLETGECLAMLVLEAEVTSVAVAPDRRTVIAGDKSGRVNFLELDIDALN